MANNQLVQITVLNNSSYALGLNDPSTVTVQGKLVSEPEAIPLGHRGTGGVWQAEIQHIHWPKLAGIGPVQLPGVQALSLYRFEEAPDYVLVILVSKSLSQVAKVAFVRRDQVKFDEQYLRTLENASSVTDDASLLFHLSGHPFVVEATVQFLLQNNDHGLNHTTLQVTFSNRIA